MNDLTAYEEKNRFEDSTLNLFAALSRIEA